MIKKLFILLKNYDTIMEMVDNYSKTYKIPEKKKNYSLKNTPKAQLDLIEQMKHK